VRDLEVHSKKQELEHYKGVGKVLVICTGGTLTMEKTDNGYVTQRGIGDRLKSNRIFYDEAYVATKREKGDWEEGNLITPMTPFNNRIQFEVLEFEQLIDSSNVDLQD